MNVGATTGVGTDTYAAYASATEKKPDTATVEAGNKADTGKASESKAAEEGVVYEKDDETSKKATYSINRMSAEDRAALVSRLKADQENRQNQLVQIVQQMMTKQAATFGQANGFMDDDVWKFLASGKYTVDEAAKAQAQADIAEDGYWGVKQTSQRLFDFASALAGDDVDKMKEMQAAMEKGYKQATQAWGKELPDISKDTLNAANKLFEEYYASKNTEVISE